MTDDTPRQRSFRDNLKEEEHRDLLMLQIRVQQMYEIALGGATDIQTFMNTEFEVMEGVNLKPKHVLFLMSAMMHEAQEMRKNAVKNLIGSPIEGIDLEPEGE